MVFRHGAAIGRWAFFVAVSIEAIRPDLIAAGFFIAAKHSSRARLPLRASRIAATDRSRFQPYAAYQRPAAIRRSGARDQVVRGEQLFCCPQIAM